MGAVYFAICYFDSELKINFQETLRQALQEKLEAVRKVASLEVTSLEVDRTFEAEIV